MKNIVVLVIMLMPIFVNGQDIREIFTKIPIEAFPTSGIRKYLKDKREYLMYKGNIVKKEELKDDEIYVDTIDITNGFIRFTSLRQLEYAQHEMCYWKKNNGQKLIGLNYTYCGTTTCGSILGFYELIDTVFIKHEFESDILDKVTVDMFLDILKSRVKIENNKEVRNSFDDILKTMFDVKFILPQRGKDIKAIIDCGMDENLFVFKQKEIFLFWDGNRFRIEN